MAAEEVGVAYVRLLPSMRGFSSAASKGLSTGLTGPARKAGDKAGGAMSDGIDDGVKKGSGKLKKSAGRIGDVFKATLAGAGVAAGLTLAAGLSGALDVGAAEDNLVAQLGGGEWAEQAANVAGDLYVDAFGESMGDVADQVSQVYRSGILDPSAGEDAFAALSESALTFTDVLDQDMGISLQAVSNILDNDLADSAEEAYDILTRGSQTGVDAAGDLLETFQEYGPAFQVIGIDAADATGLMSQGLQGGARDADKVADALKEVGIRGRDGSKLTAEGFQALGLDADAIGAKFAAGGNQARGALDQVLDGLQAMTNPAERNAAAVALFGTQAEDLGDALFSLDLDTAAGELGEIGGATSRLGSAYDNAQTKITAFKRKAMDKLITFIGNKAIPLIERLAEVMGPHLEAALKTIQSLVDGINFERLAAMWSVFVDAVNGESAFDYAGTMGRIQSAGDAIKSVIDTVRPPMEWFLGNKEAMIGAFSGIGAVVLAVVVPAMIALVAPMVAAAAPFILLGVAIGALVTGFLYLYRNVDGFRRFIDAAIPAIGTVFSETFGFIQKVIETTVAVAKWIWTNFGDDILNAARATWDLIKGIVDGGLKVVSGILKIVTGVMSGDWSAAMEGLGMIADGAMIIIRQLFRTGMDLAKVALSVAWTLIKAIFQRGKDKIVEYVTDGVGQILGIAGGLAGRIASALAGVVGALTSPFRTAVNTINGLLGGVDASIAKASGRASTYLSGASSRGGGSTAIRMHSGGIVSGRHNSEQPRTLQAGEGVFTRDQMSALAPAADQQHAAPASSNVIIDASNVDAALLRWLRTAVKVEGQGDVQVALGGFR